LIFDGIALQAPTALLELQKTTTTPTVASGGTASYTITATNPSVAGVLGVTLTDALPTGFTFAALSTVSFTGGATRPTVVNPSAGATSLQFGTFNLPAGSTASVTFTVHVPTLTTTATFSNVASATVAAGATPVISDSVPITITVTGAAAATAASSPELPATGTADNPQLTSIGAGLLGLGLLLLIVSRPRRKRPLA
jgi:uncharacterized repeat protein (TIGR01451 family)/LPXTG-motif cell wall-anchored protein